MSYRDKRSGALISDSRYLNQSAGEQLNYEKATEALPEENLVGELSGEPEVLIPDGVDVTDSDKVVDENTSETDKEQGDATRQSESEEVTKETTAE